MILGIDIGGTNIVLGVYDKNFNKILTKKIKTSNFSDFDLFTDFIFDFINNNKIEAIGVGAPNGNSKKGTIENAPNLPWKNNIKLKQIWENKFKIPVAITNDANAIAYAELKFGFGKQYSDFVVVTLGTGVGSGIVINSEVLEGAYGIAGELGHITIVPEGRLCNCGKKGCLEAYAGKKGILQTYLELGGKPKGIKELNNLAKNNDKKTLLTFEITGKYIGFALANFIHLFDTQAIIFYGGIANNLIFMEKAIKESMEKNLMKQFRNKVKIHLSKFMQTEGATLGASYLVKKNL